MLIAPSLLSADFANLQRDILTLEEAGADYIHMDIMDGHFVPNITFGADQLAQLRRVTKLPFDVHLMISDPEKYIPAFAEAGSDIITIHQEACLHLHRSIELIKSYKIKAGVSLNPATPVFMLDEILEFIDLVLVMSVNPGFGAQKFIASSTKKITDLKAKIGGRDILLEVDGGVNLKTAPLVCGAGADILVAGSYIFSGDIKENIKALRNVCK